MNKPLLAVYIIEVRWYYDIKVVMDVTEMWYIIIIIIIIKKIGYNINVLRQTACLSINRITVDEVRK